MSANPIWIAGYFGPVAGASPVWIAPSDGTVPSAVQSQVVSYYAPVAGATAVWIAGFFAPPPAAIGATPITISGWGGSGGGGPPPVTSVWSASDAAANGMTLSNGGLTAHSTANAWGSIRGSISQTSGKLYVEFLANLTQGASGYDGHGFASSGFIPTGYLGQGGNGVSVGITDGGNHPGDGSGFTPNYATAIIPHTNDVWAFAIDFTGGSIWIAQNNVWLNGSNPAIGSLPIVSFVVATVGALFPGVSMWGANETWTLQSTAASQKYAPPSGFSAWDSAAPTHSPQALAYLARTVGGNEGGNGANIATLIDGLVSDGVWAKLDALYVLAQQNQTDAQLNLVGTSYTLPTGSTFIAYQGLSAFPANGLNSGFNPSSSPSPRFTNASASAGIWAYNTVDNGPQMGSGFTGPSTVYILVNYGDNWYCAINGGSIIPTPAATGLFVGDRNSPTAYHNYLNGADLGPISTAASGFDGLPIYVGGNGVNNQTAQTLSAAFIGASLGAAGQLALYNRLRTYMTAVGVP